MRSRTARSHLLAILLLCSIGCFAWAAPAQWVQAERPTDTSAQASPLSPPPAAPVVDSSFQASPVLHQPAAPPPRLIPHTALHLRLSHAIDSGHLKNGQTVPATLAGPVALAPQGSLSAGTSAALTVVETLPAGRIYAAGEFSLQVLRVGPIPVFTNTLTFRGKPGHKDLPDSAPAVGTDAGLPAGAELIFHVLPPPSAAAKPAPVGKSGPGAVNGIAVGSPPPPGSSSSGAKSAQTVRTRGKKNGAHARVVQPAENTPRPAQHLGQSSVAPNQPAPPQNATPASSTRPR